MARPNLFDFFSKRRAAKSPDDASQPAQQQPVTVASQQQQRELPKIDSSNAIGSLSKILGPSPEERATEEQRLQDHRQKMHGWTALFNGLRHLGNLYYATKGAPGQKLSDPHQQVEQQYQAERKRLDDMQRARQSYATMLHNIKRQEKADELAERRLARQEEETKIRRQTADARNEAYRAKANGDEARAAFYNAKADALEQGIPYDIAVKRATEAQKLAQARLANVRADNGGSSQGNYGYKIVEGYDGSGNKVKERIPTSGGGTSPQRRSGSKTNLLPQNNQQQGGSLLPKKK